MSDVDYTPGEYLREVEDDDRRLRQEILNDEYRTEKLRMEAELDRVQREKCGFCDLDDGIHYGVCRYCNGRGWVDVSDEDEEVDE